MPHHQTPNTAIPTKTHAKSPKTHQAVTSPDAVGRNAARLRRAQKEELEEIFNKPPSEAGAWAELWDVPAP